MCHGVAWRGVGDATVEIPRTCSVHQTTRDVPRTRLILHVFQLQVHPDFIVFVRVEGRHSHRDNSRVDAELQICAITDHNEQHYYTKTEYAVEALE